MVAAVLPFLSGEKQTKNNLNGENENGKRRRVALAPGGLRCRSRQWCRGCHTPAFCTCRTPARAYFRSEAPSVKISCCGSVFEHTFVRGKSVVLL